jgi:mono/diheme cytochrome c family protein
MTKRQLLIIGATVVLLLAAVLLAACGSDTTTTTAGPTTTASGTVTTAGGAIDAAALYAANCASCHKDVPEDSADKVQAVVEQGKESMPGFTDKLSAEEIAALSAWVAAGGK